MKTKLISVLVLIITLTSGCNKIHENSILMRGQEKLENHQYDEALNLLSQVLDEDPENDSARAMYMQARKMDMATAYEKNYDYDKAIKELDAIVNINNGSKKIKRESINKKSELEKLKDTFEKQALERKENAKESSKKYINKLESEIIYNNKKNEESEKEESQKEDIKEHENEKPIENAEEDREETTNRQLNDDGLSE